VGSEDVERIEAAAEAYSRGDLEPLVTLLDDEVDWRAPTRGHLWRKHTPRCHGPEEARANFEIALKKASLRPGFTGLELNEIHQSGDRIMVGATPKTGHGTGGRGEEGFFQVLTMRGGKIVDIQGCRNRREALKRLERGS
jgi:ketosteroid isomerase-like protein